MKQPTCYFSFFFTACIFLQTYTSDIDSMVYDNKRINELNFIANRTYEIVRSMAETTATIQDKLGTLQGSMESPNPVSVQTLNVVENINSEVEELYACDFCSQFDLINSKLDVCDLCSKTDSMQNTTQCILDVLCDFVITQTDIPFTITQSGVYCLKEDVTATTTAITVSASNVVLDLQGHLVNGPREFGILTDGIVLKSVPGVALVDVTVKNGATSEFYNGFYVQGAPNSPMVNITFDNCIGAGNHNCGFRTERGGTLTYKNCVARHNRMAGFFDSSLGKNITYLQCIAASNGVSRTTTSPEGGFVSENTVDVTYRNCKAESNLANGYSFAATASTVAQGISCMLVTNCEAYSNLATGIYANAGLSIKVRNCESSNNKVDGFFVGAQSFIFSFKNNNAMNNSRHGFTFSNTAGSRGGLIISNTAVGNQDNGFNNTASTPMTRNKFQNNSAVKNLSGNYAGIPSLDTATTTTAAFWLNLDL